MISFCSKSFIIYAAIMLLIAGGLLMPNLIVKHDTIAHIGAFFILMLWPAVTLVQPKHIFLVSALLVMAGGLAEFIQQYTPARTPSWEDFAMNVVGVVLGLGCGWLIRKRLKSL